jgi:chitinase
MKNIYISLLLLAVIFLSACKSNVMTSAQEKKVIMAYLYPGNRVMEASEIRADLLTHVIFAFANVVDDLLIDGYLADSLNYAVLRSVRDENPHLKLMVAAGGWGWSGNFSDMALTAESRSRFIESTVAYLQKHDLDGIDLDWEYPGLPGNNNIHRPEDRENFTSLVRELRHALDELGDGQRHYLLTIAAGAFQGFLTHTEMDIVAQYLDFVNLMTYDFTGEWSQTTGHHANLFSQGEGNSADKSIALFEQAGVPSNKIVIGAAFYGRGWKVADPQNLGLGQQGRGLANVSLGYRNLVDGFLSQSLYEQHWDEQARAPFLWNAADSIFITYENPRSMQEKARYAKERGLGGVMFWQYFTDHDNSLLTALYDELNVTP